MPYDPPDDAQDPTPGAGIGLIILTVGSAVVALVGWLIYRYLFVAVVAVGLCSAASAGPIGVYFLAGQSNAAGFAPADGLPDYLADQPDVLYRPTTGLVRTLGPVNGTMGPEITLGRSLADAGGDPIAIVKFAIGGTSMLDWAPNGGKRYAGLVLRMNSTLGYLSNAGYTPTVRGGFWVQGEEDALYGDLAASYAEHLEELLAAFRANWGAELPIGIARINAPIRPYRDLVRDAQAEAADWHTTVWNTDDLPLHDAVHYDQLGQLRLGRRFASDAIGWRYRVETLPSQRGVPEPGAWAMLAIGCSAILARRRSL